MSEINCDSSASSTDSADSVEAPRERLPPSTLQAMQRLFIGPKPTQLEHCCSLSARIRLWAYIGPQAGGVLGGVAVFVVCHSAGTEMWESIAWAGLCVWVGVGVVVGEATQQVATALVGMERADLESTSSGGALNAPLTNGPDSPRWDNNGGDNELVAFLEKLLSSRVSSRVARSTTRAVTVAGIQVVVFVVLLELCFVGLFFAFERDTDVILADHNSEELVRDLAYCMVLTAAVSAPCRCSWRGECPRCRFL